MQTVEDWKLKLGQVMSEYPRLNQFNADKMPGKHLNQKREKCKGRKHFSERLCPF
jgi:hypothetical protein